MLVDDLPGHLIGQVVPDRVGPVGAGQQEHGAVPGGGEQVVLLEEREVVAGNEVGPGAQVGAADQVRPEAQVRHRDGAGLLRVIHEVTLRVIVRVGSDDLDGVLVGADRAVRAEAVEHALEAAGLLDGPGRVHGEAGVGHVVVDAHREVVLGGIGVEVVEYSLDHRRRELLGAEAVATAHRAGIADGLEPALFHGFAQGGTHVDIERFADGAGLLGAVEHGDGLDRGREAFGK